MLKSDNMSDIQKSIETAVTNYLSGEAIKKSYISYAKIGSIILSIPGVEDYSNLKINGAAANIKIADDAVPTLGSVIIS